MPPFRLLHAAGFNPDAVLLKSPAEIADFCDDAPFAAFERLVGVAIEQNVDAVLISLDDRVDRLSLGAVAALDEQFQRLKEHEIPLILAITEAEAVYQALSREATGLIVLRGGESTKVCEPNGREVAVIRCGETVEDVSGPRIVHHRTGDLIQIAVLPHLGPEETSGDGRLFQDYIACGRGSRQTVRFAGKLAHSPGVMQGTSPSMAGPQGATLAAISRGSGVELEFVPTAAVRYETIAVSCELEDDADDVALRMIECLHERRAEDGEQAWIVEWRIEAADPLCRALSDPQSRAHLKSQLPGELQDAELFHRIAVVPHPLWSALEQPFAAEFTAALAEQEAALWSREDKLGSLGVDGETLHRERLAELVSQADRAAVLGNARRLGARVTTAALENDPE